LDLCFSRWFKLPGLGTSVERDNFHETYVANVNLGIENGEEVKDDDAVNLHCQPYKAAPTRGRHAGRHEIREITNDLALAVWNVPNIQQRYKYVGELISLTEKLKGNSNVVQGQSLDNLLDGHLSMYERSSTRIKLHSRDASLNEVHRILTASPAKWWLVEKK
jgi:hypothetical protein